MPDSPLVLCLKYWPFLFASFQKGSIFIQLFLKLCWHSLVVVLENIFKLCIRLVLDCFEGGLDIFLKLLLCLIYPVIINNIVFLKVVSKSQDRILLPPFLNLSVISVLGGVV